MAQNKKKSTYHCLVHVCVYTLPFVFTDLLTWQMLLIGMQHYLQDRYDHIERFMAWKSPIFSHPDNVCWPWSLIVTDQVVHILWMAFVVWLGVLCSN